MDNINVAIAHSYHKKLREFSSQKPRVDVNETIGMYICFNVAEFLKSCAGGSDESTNTPTINFSEIIYSNGIYIGLFDGNYDCHEFIMHVKDGFVEIINGYGGYIAQPARVSMDAEQWTSLFYKLRQTDSNQEYLELFEELFGIPKSYVVCNNKIDSAYFRRLS